MRADRPAIVSHLAVSLLRWWALPDEAASGHVTAGAFVETGSLLFGLLMAG
jgi:hypothetical protein